jgi:hypothetical protein
MRHHRADMCHCPATAPEVDLAPAMATSYTALRLRYRRWPGGAVEGIPGRQTHDYKTPRHHHAARRAGDRHRQGDRRHPRITLHFTPTSGSWLNMVEIFFGIITRQAIRRGSSAASKTSSTPFAASSTATTTAASPSPGPKTPRPSSPKRNDHPRSKTKLLRDTRHRYPSSEANPSPIIGTKPDNTPSGDTRACLAVGYLGSVPCLLFNVQIFRRASVMTHSHEEDRCLTR